MVANHTTREGNAKDKKKRLRLTVLQGDGAVKVGEEDKLGIGLHSPEIRRARHCVEVRSKKARKRQTDGLMRENASLCGAEKIERRRSMSKRWEGKSQRVERFRSQANRNHKLSPPTCLLRPQPEKAPTGATWGIIAREPLTLRLGRSPDRLHRPAPELRCIDGTLSCQPTQTLNTPTILIPVVVPQTCARRCSTPPAC